MEWFVHCLPACLHACLPACLPPARPPTRRHAYRRRRRWFCGDFGDPPETVTMPKCLCFGGCLKDSWYKDSLRNLSFRETMPLPSHISFQQTMGSALIGPGFLEDPSKSKEYKNKWKWKRGNDGKQWNPLVKQCILRRHGNQTNEK